jgi:hypothetical protein
METSSTNVPCFLSHRKIYQKFSLLLLSWSPIYLIGKSFSILMEQGREKDKEEKQEEQSTRVSQRA